MLNKFTKNNMKYFLIDNQNIKFPYLKILRKKIVEFIKSIKSYDCKISSYTIPHNKLVKLLSGHWVDIDAINHTHNLTSNYVISWTFDNIVHNITIKCTNEKWLKINNKKRLYLLINIINFIYSISETRNPINIYLILTQLTKNINNNETISPKHINSGYSDINKKIIVIWREEEFEKVIFHELHHIMKLDHSNITYNVNIPFKIKGILRYFEAITDYYAILYNTIYISLYTNKSIDKIFNIEYNFMKNQANVMNNFLNLNNWNNNIVIKQNSSAFEYYIVKYIIFKNIIEENNSSIITEPHILINTILQNGFEPEKYIYLNSMRMTLFELD